MITLLLLENKPPPDEVFVVLVLEKRPPELSKVEVTSKKKSIFGKKV